MFQDTDADAILNAIPSLNYRTDSLPAPPKKLSKSKFQQIMKNQIEQLAKNCKIETIQINQKKKRGRKPDNDTSPIFN